MEGGPTGGIGSSGGGPAPFLLKTYDMIDDSSTDNIVSWSSNMNSFVVWNPPEFARQLLPTYFKHNNFSSFIRQLNTYGFRKIDPEKWEFANEDFIKDQKQLLKNIHRRKPIHSHSQPQGSTGDGERAALDEEIERLLQEKTSLKANVWRFKQQQSGTKHQLEGLEIRVQEMEQRQQRMMAFIAKAVQNPTFVEHLIRMTGSSMDISAITKKRRLPGVDFCQDVAENSFVDNYSCTSKPDFGHIFQQDFSNKLKLELSPAVSDSNLVSLSAQSSNENGENVLRRVSEGDPKDVLMRTEGLSFAPETLELSDTGTSFSLRKDTPLLRRAKSSESSRLHCLPHSWISGEEGDGHISCHLNLTLASTPLQVSDSHYSSRIPQLDQEVGSSVGLKLSNSSKEADIGVLVKNKNYVDADVTPSTLQNVAVINQGHGAGQGRVNDLFWEQFLTERPGSSDTEEASSTFRGNVHDEQEERKTAQVSWRKDMEQLTL